MKSSTKTAVFYEPNGAYRGRDEIDRIAGVIKALLILTSNISRSRRRGDRRWLSVRWVSGSRAGHQLYAGTDFVIVRAAKLPPSISS